MSNKLVAYFSVSGVTKKVAQAIAEEKGADIVEIKPEVTYTNEDLDWTNMKSRSSVEMQDKSFRPAMQDDGVDIAQYDTIYLGFPIWWYVAPTIVNTFLEAHNFAGKKIILFATAGSSGWGNTLSELAASVDPSAEMMQTRVLLKDHTDQDIQTLAKSI